MSFAAVRSGGLMARCEVCGNDYDKSFQVLDGTTHVFDCFECASDVDGSRKLRPEDDTARSFPDAPDADQ
jgi:hypothetical protein